MTPPEDQDERSLDPQSQPAPAVARFAPRKPATFAPGLLTLQHRPDFLRCATGRKQGTAGFLLQARPRNHQFGDDADLPRIGFTATKKIGNAVARNRAKRRMRALARAVLASAARPGWDYVLVARPEATIARPYAQLLSDLATAITSVHRDRT